MEIHFQNLGPENWKAQISLAFGCEEEDILKEYPELDKACPWLAVAPAMRDFKGMPGEMVLVHGHPELNIPRVLAIGLGKKSELSPDRMRDAVADGVRKCKKLGVSSILLPETFLANKPGGRERLVEECVCAALLSLYSFTKLKTVKQDDQKDPQWMAIGFSADRVPDGSQAAARRGEISAEAVGLARDLDNMPGNMIYPETLAIHAVKLAQKHGFKCEVFDEARLESEGFGCLLAVGSGSTHPPRLVIIEYAHKDHEQDKPLILVGKGITFDSGGICLKPATNMYQMKCDMSGAAAVLAVVSALARENAQRRVIGLMACAENLPSGQAYRPGDILTSYNGETVEVINTDAEGRLVLCDALSYAQKRWTPSAIIDIATLTGACAVALGKGLAGLFCENSDLVQRIMACGATTGENFWRLPLWESYKEQLKSEVADIKHTAAREGGAITAALFLEHFIKGGELWAHLDIAGVDWSDKSTPLCPEGASGFGTRTLLELARGGIE